MNIYGYQRPLGRIDDIPELRDAFIAVFDAKSKNETARFGLLYGRHILTVTGFEPRAEITKAFGAVQRWIDGETNYHEARTIDIYQYARTETDPVKKAFYKTAAQIACIPHVKAHGLWAADFGVTLINKMRPNDLGAARDERETQIALFKGVM
ncbi:MAG: hypothetical protein LBL66_05005 [Clostridiales bacterium]|jgi:hypothetical protein|nr:hypothetical protein [Clostridiales bacterium]